VERYVDTLIGRRARMREVEITTFRRIYVTEPSHDMSALKKYTDCIVFLTTGYEDLSILSDVAKIALNDFDPDQDAFVPIGKLITNVIIGMYVNEKNLDIVVGLYRDKDYTFYTMEV
jgi:hypothetical protein